LPSAKDEMAGKQRTWARTLRRLIFGTIFLGMLAAGIVGSIAWRELSADLPPIDRILHYRPPTATKVYADDGTQIAEFFFERRYLVPLERVPPLVRAAFIAAEDSNFYRHKGIDIVSIARAAIRNFQRGGVAQGGSTITQQVVKSLLLTPEKSYQRKATEVMLAVRLEGQLTKDQILYLYLNQIYFGGGAHGVAAAAQIYFGKDVSELTLAEGALLAGLPQAPSRYSPFRYPAHAKARQRYVLARMEEEHFISPAQQVAALQQDIVLASREPAAYNTAPDYVEHVRRSLEDRYGGSAPYEMGLHVHTAVNLKMQHAAETSLREGLESLDGNRRYAGALYHLEAAAIDPFLQRQKDVVVQTGRTYSGAVTEVYKDEITVAIGKERGVIDRDTDGWANRKGQQTLRVGDVVPVQVLSRSGPRGMRLTLDESPPVEGAVLAMDPSTGYVKAVVGGYDFKRSQFNRALQSERQPGSAFKPIIYAAALDHGYTPATLVFDGPIIIPNGNLPDWTPRNYKNKYYGWTTLRQGLVKSMNTVTVRVVNSIGLNALMDTVNDFGLYPTPPPRNLSISLGTAEVTLLNLTQAFCVFPTLGERPTPIFIVRIVDDEGRIVERSEQAFKRVLEPATAYMVTSMMQAVVEEGTGRHARALGRPCAAKTGTTNDFHDAWFLGYTPDLVAGVWVGFDSKRSLGDGASGGRVAAPIWTKFMEQALEGAPIRDFRIPPEVTFVNVDRATGLRATAGRPSVLEVFRRGQEPVRSPMREPALPEPDWEYPDDGHSLPSTLEVEDVGYVAN
jgi:penicillin-binding protein 1A